MSPSSSVAARFVAHWETRSATARASSLGMPTLGSCRAGSRNVRHVATLAACLPGSAPSGTLAAISAHVATHSSPPTPGFSATTLASFLATECGRGLVGSRRKSRSLFGSGGSHAREKASGSTCNRARCGDGVETPNLGRPYRASAWSRRSVSLPSTKVRFRLASESAASHADRASAAEISVSADSRTRVPSPDSPMFFAPDARSPRSPAVDSNFGTGI